MSINEVSKANGEPDAVEAVAMRASQTASEYINEQLALEADAREILPFKFDKCTYALGPLRQGVFACLTCSPPPASSAQVYKPAGICYACSISCHGEHTLVELFHRRNFTCDCGTTRFLNASTCALRSDPETGSKGVHSQKPAESNVYNQNFQNRFCGCGQEYNAETEKGTMYQCLGLGNVETGGCGEDWWHAHCLMGLPKDWPEHPTKQKSRPKKPDGDTEEDEYPVPEDFPEDDQFTTLICYKCVASQPWIKQYAGTKGFLPPLYRNEVTSAEVQVKPDATAAVPDPAPTLKRKAEDDGDAVRPSSPIKRPKEEEEGMSTTVTEAISEAQPGTKHKHESLPPAPSGSFSILATSDFREDLCHCPQCFPKLAPYPQLLEEEDDYEPSLSDSEQSLVGGSGARSAGTASLLERGEAALNNVDRVRAIEGVMVYNHLKDKVKAFLKPYAESGQAVGAEDIKAYFEKLRGDEAAIKDAGQRPQLDGDDANGAKDGEGSGNRREQSGY